MTDVASTRFGVSAVERRLEPGELLCEEGATDSDVFQIVSGSFNVERATAEGPMVVASVGAGRIVGEVTNAMGGTRTATLRATEPSVVSVLTQDQFVSWLDDHPDIATEIAADARLRMNRTRAASVLVKLFGFENQSVVDAIVNEIRWITLAPGELLFDQGDESDAAYLVIAGRLSLLARNDDGDVSLDIEIGRGEIVGEMGIIDDAPRSAGARAIRETTLALISRESFNAIAAQFPKLLLRVFHTIMERLTHKHQPDNRAHVIGVAVTAPVAAAELVEAMSDAVKPFGSPLYVSHQTLGRFVRDVSGPGGTSRVSEFLHEADVLHDYVMLESDHELTPWSVNVAKQSDRFIVVCSANPDADEVSLIESHLEQLSVAQRGTAWIVRLHHPNTVRPVGSARYTRDFGVSEVHNICAGSADHLARIGRLATGNGRGVVLGGGGARGLAHIGALRALQEAGLGYDRIGGASMGAVIAGLAAQDLSPDEMLEASIEEFTSNLLDYTVPLVSLVKGAKMAAGLRRRFEAWDITDTWIPFYCVSTDITIAELAVHRSGPMATAIRASVAIPCVLPPVPIDGHLHVDGGVLDNVPAGTMRDDPSIGTVIAIDVSPAGGPAAKEDYGLSVSGFDAARARFSRRRESNFPDIGQTLISSMLIGSSKAKNEITIESGINLYIDLDLAGVGLLKFENHAEVVERGYTSSVPTIAAYLESLTPAPVAVSTPAPERSDAFV